MAPGIHLLLAAALAAHADGVPPIGAVKESANPAARPATPVAPSNAGSSKRGLRPARPAGVAQPPKPRLFARACWDSKPPPAPSADPVARSRIIIHHTADAVSAAELALPPGSPESEAAAKEALRGIRRLHRGEFQWADIAYHYLVDWEGRVWEARPIGSVGAHTEGHNRGSIGVALMGNWDQAPRDANETRARERQLEGLEAFVTWLAWEHTISPQAILGHHEFYATACPGRFLARKVREDFERERHGEDSSPLRELRLRVVARLGGPAPAPAALARALPAPPASRVANGLAALTASGALGRAFDNSGFFAAENLVPAGDVARALPPGSLPPAPPAPAAKDPAAIDDGKYRLPFASQQWPGVRRGGAYGAPRGYGRHTGIDFQANEGTAVYSSRPGRVTFVDTRYTRAFMRTPAGHKGYGNRVIVEHPDGTETWYCHLEPGSVQVKVGEVVTRDSQLGNVGDTGFSHGPHLHFMVLSANGTPRNPAIALGHTPPQDLHAKQR